MIFFSKVLAIAFFLRVVLSYKLYNALNSIIFTNIGLPTADVHSEYYFGTCASLEKKLVAKHVLKYREIKDKLIFRAWLNVDKEPTCIYIRAKSAYADLVRYHAFKFNICICRLVYTYGGLFFNHIFYEWYIPVEMMKEIVWELHFYND